MRRRNDRARYRPAAAAAVRATLYEPYVTSANEYVALAERANGPLPRPVDFGYPWGEAIAELEDRRPDLRIINLETSVTRHAEPEPKRINYRMSPENFACIGAAEIDCCTLANNHVLDWGEAGHTSASILLLIPIWRSWRMGGQN